MIVIGVDPHKRVHTASAVDAATNRRLASVEVEASLAGYRQRGNGPSSSVSTGGLWRTLAVWVGIWRSGWLPATNGSTMSPPRRPLGFASCHVAADARTTSSTSGRGLRRGSCKVRPTRSTPRTWRRCWRCSTNAATIPWASGPGWSTSSMLCSET